MTSIEKKFNKDMKDIYINAKKDCGYNASRFLEMLSRLGGIETAKRLIMKPGGTEGFAKLIELGRLDLTVEAHVIKPQYSELFTKEEIKVARKNLESYGFNNKYGMEVK